MIATAMRDDLSSILQRTRKSRFVLDLSQSNLIEVLEAYRAHKQKTSSRFTNLSVINNLRSLQDSCLQVLMPDDVTDEFYAYFVRYGVQKGLKMASIKNYCDSIRTALTWGAKHGCPVSSTYEENNITPAEPFRVSLSADDISHIAHFDCNTVKCRKDHRRKLEQVRDSFVLQANLFCRYSDLRNISRSNFDGHVFSCVQQKTGGKAVVDMDRYSVCPKVAFAILKKYDYQAPYKGDINNFNRCFHELLKHIGGCFDEEVTFEVKEDGKIIKKSFKKRDLIASHCARRTAITLAVGASKTETEVRRCSGHVNAGRDSFRKYIVYE